MKLFLASNFYLVSNLLLTILSKEPNKLNVAFIPTAADPYNEKPWMYEDRNALVRMGFHISDLDIKNKTKKQLVEETKNTDILFVSGGNTYYLLSHTKKSGFNEVAKELVTRGVIYVGSSAGAVLACPTIEHIEDLDDKSIANLSSYKGIGLTQNLILPHYDEPKYENKFKRIMGKWGKGKYKIITLNNNQTLIVNGGKTTIAGL